MKKISLLFLLLITAVSASGQDSKHYSPLSDIEYNLSGFVTATAFSDKTWFDNTKNVALNYDLQYQDWIVHTQLAEPYKNIIRRFTIEKNFSNDHNDSEVSVQVGRFPRLQSFYNNILDDPGSIGFAMIPLGEFSRRVILNRSFNSLDGIKISHTMHYNKGIVKIVSDHGIPSVEEQCLTQNEISKSQCTPDYSIGGKGGNYDLGITYDDSNLMLTGFVGSIKMNISQNTTSTNTTKLIYNIDEINYDYIKTGIKYSQPKWWVQSELSFIDFKVIDYNTQYKKTLDLRQWKNYYVLGGYNWTEDFNTYISFSNSTSNKNIVNNDKLIGATLTKNNSIVSLEYHKGKGYSWKQYFATDEKWNSWVLSFTQRF